MEIAQSSKEGVGSRARRVPESSLLPDPGDGKPDESHEATKTTIEIAVFSNLFRISRELVTMHPGARLVFDYETSQLAVHSGLKAGIDFLYCFLGFSTSVIVHELPWVS